MIVIKDIEILEVPRDIHLVRHHELYGVHRHDFSKPHDYSKPSLDKAIVTEEMIRGRRFRNSHGVDVCIGMSEKVQLALGLPFEAYDNLNTALMDSQKRRLDFIDKVHQASLWTRIKYVFTSRI